MDPDYQKFGRGPRELTGAVDLISRYKLLPHHNFFCKRSLHVSISDSHYLHNVVGDTEVRKGEGMQLSQLIPDSSLSRETNMHIQPFGLDILKEAFQLKETAPLSLPPSEKGTPTIPGKSKKKSKDKEKKHKDKNKKKEREKHKHPHKDLSKDKEEKKDKSGHQDSGNDHTKRHHKKKRKGEGDEQTNSTLTQENQANSSKIDDMELKVCRMKVDHKLLTNNWMLKWRILRNLLLSAVKSSEVQNEWLTDSSLL